ncbi:hypothetical protein V7079_19530 [Priestia megaterium]|uniref:hypothetical protein n=1 Tax=Priestia megaterium TaxID=1404 RepID=UPI000BF7D6FB|nr:hypothetical protein [Priestia megaterium]PFK02131.1 hypothetical protein COI96_07000 [Priestia megaterium]PMD08002.1 hypothetical protein CJ194_18535 [Priestia megaterium]
MTKEALQATKSINYFFLKFVTGEIDLNPTSAKDPMLAGIVKEEIRLFFTQITGKDTIDPNVYTVFENELIEGGYTDNINQSEFHKRLALAIIEVMGTLDFYIYNFYYFMSNKAYGTTYKTSSLLDVLAIPDLEEGEQGLESLSFNCFHITNNSAHIELSSQFQEKEKKEHNLYNALITVSYDLKGNYKEILVGSRGNMTTYKLTEKQKQAVKIYIEDKSLKVSLLKQIKFEGKLANLIEKHNSKECYCTFSNSCLASRYLQDKFEKHELFEQWRKEECSF